MGVYSGSLFIDPLPAWATEDIKKAHKKPIASDQVVPSSAPNPPVPTPSVRSTAAAQKNIQPIGPLESANSRQTKERTPTAIKGLFF